MKRATHIAALLGLSGLLTLSAQADLPVASFEANCNAWGTPAVCTSVWSEGLSPDLRVQVYRIADPETDATLFAGRGVYRTEGGSVIGYWEDTQGSIHRLTGTWQDGALEVIWGEPGAPAGKSRYEFSESGMSAEDWSATAAGWRSFMTITYPANSPD